MFDASSITKSGYPLNDVLAKGINSMNSLLSIFLRFRCNIVAVHTDIQKMCNVIKLLQTQCLLLWALLFRHNTANHEFGLSLSASELDEVPPVAAIAAVTIFSQSKCLYSM